MPTPDEVERMAKALAEDGHRVSSWRAAAVRALSLGAQAPPEPEGWHAISDGRVAYGSDVRIACWQPDGGGPDDELAQRVATALHNLADQENRERPDPRPTPMTRW